MKRRGPDDEGLWTDDQHCILGFRRLAILDLSPAGHQPMLTRGGRYALVFNGEVYNFRDLRHELEQKGIQFCSTGDAEVVLYSLAEWGTKALDRFNGMFALAFYDTVEKRLLLARDHAGIKPLYYMDISHGLVFASQYDQLLAHPWSQRLSIDEEALGLYLRLGYIPAPYALLQNTYMLEPGTWLEIQANGSIQTEKYFEFPVYRRPSLHGMEAYQAVDEAVTRAVQRHLVSDVPVGTFLSGGVDSPLVTAKVREASNAGIKAFTVGTNGDQFDESPDAIHYAREIGIDHVVEQFSPDEALNMLDDVIAACGEPFGDYSIFPTMVVSKMARRHVKVMLSGDGGDEPFWGYTGRFGMVLQENEDFRWPYGWRTVQRGIDKVFGFNYRPHLKKNSIGDWYRIKHQRVSEKWLHSILPDTPPWPRDFSLFQYQGWETDRTAQWLRWNEFIGHLTMVLLKVDRASMFHSLEVRVPLLDREVIEVATRVDWQSCLNIEKDMGKLPLRWALSRHVHHQTKSKRGFTVPMGDWLRGPLREVFEDVVFSRREILGVPVHCQELRKLFKLHCSGQVDHTAWWLWMLLSLALWEEEHFQSRYQ